MALLLLLGSQLTLHKAVGNDILTVVGVTAQVVQGSRQMMEWGAGGRGGG